MQKGADCPLLHLVCIYDYITVLRFCVGFVLELPSNFSGDFLLESSKVPTIAFPPARLRRKNDFEYPPLTLWIFSAEGLFLISRLSRSAERSKRYFHGRRRNRQRHLLRCFLRKRGAAGNKPSPSSLRDATSPERGRFCSTYRQMAKSSPFGGAGKPVRV